MFQLGLNAYPVIFVRIAGMYLIFLQRIIVPLCRTIISFGIKRSSFHNCNSNPLANNYYNTLFINNSK